jgi:hypothetical protein
MPRWKSSMGCKSVMNVSTNSTISVIASPYTGWHKIFREWVLLALLEFKHFARHSAQWQIYTNK